MNEKKRIHILETAMVLFNQNGFDSTPTSKIAKKAKISVGTLFNYFPTKSELIQAIYVEVKIHSRKTFLIHLKDNASEHDNLQSMWKAVINWGVDNPEEFKYLEMFSSSPYINQFKNEKTLETYQKFRESILEALSPTSICNEYPKYLLMYIDNALHAATRYIINNQHIHNVDHFINQSFDLIWHGFVKK
ncbi:MAG: TetR/AcrR family transcriptional regulator [Tenericutes bacterium]|jgi:AcrR family transcriptional regulator|nr:TetR/AcrR family transcriptional regulator [Mycoplasmatota bacterium]